MIPRFNSILIIEDNPGDARIIIELLKESKSVISVVHKTSLQSGLEQLSTGLFDIVLLDLSLPDSKGIDTVKLVSSSFPFVPFIVLTGNDDDELSIQSLESGAEDYLRKGSINYNLLVRSGNYAIERKKSTKQLLESESRYRFLVENSADCISLLDIELNYIYASPSIIKLRGISSSEIIGINIKEFLSTDSYQKLLDIFNKQLNHEFSQNSEYTQTLELEIIRKDGSNIWEENSIKFIKDINGKLVEIMTLSKDITVRKNTENMIRNSELRFRTIWESSADGMRITDEDGKIILVNNAYCKIFGKEKQELEGQYLFVCYASGNEDHILQKHRKGFINRSVETHFEKEVTLWNKKTIWLQVTNSFLDNDNEASLLLGIFRDITNQKKEQFAVIQSEKKYREIFEYSPAGIFKSNVEGKILSTNKAFANLLGYSSFEEISNLNMKDLYFNPTERLNVLERANSRLVLETEIHWKKKNGESIWIDTILRVIHNDAGEVEFYEGHVLDITEKKNNEMRLKTLFDISHYDYTEENELLNFALEESVKLTNSRVGYLHLINEDQKTIKLLMWSSEVQKHCKVVSDDEYPLDSAGIWADCVRTGQPSIHNDYQNYPNKKGLPEGHFPIIRDLNVAVTFEGKFVSVIGVANKSIDYNDSDSKQVSLIMEETWRIIREKRYQKQIIIERNKIKKILETSLDCIHVIDLNGNVVEVTPSFSNHLGYSIPELLNMNVLDFDITIKDRSQLIEILADISNHNRIFFAKHKRKDGTIRYVEISTSATELNGKTLIYASLRDITEKRLADELLKENEERFRSMFYNEHSIMMIIHPETGKIIDVNQAAINFYGYSREAFLQKMYIFDFNVDARISNLKDLWLSKNNRINTFEAKHKLFAGNLKDVEVHSGPINVRGKSLIFTITYDITEKKKKEEEIKIFSTAISNSPFSIIITNVDGKIQYVNQAFAIITGYQPHEAIGKKPSILKSGHTPLKTYSELWDTILDGKIWRGELLNRKKTGETYWENISIAPIKNESGVITHFVAVKEDITEKVNLFRNLEIAKEQAVKADKLKTEFLAQMSHEIRTPLNVLLSCSSYYEELLSDQMTPDLEMAFKGTKTAGFRIIRTIELIMNMSRLATGTFDLKKENLNICKDVLEEIVENYKAEASTKQLDLNMSSNCNFCKISVDRYCASQIFSNLIDNAIKYTEKGKVDINVDNQDGKIVSVSISDTGIGISEEYLQKIYQPFSQEEQGYSRSFEGNGLGLALVKKYCDLNDIEISVTTEKHVGTTFILKFKVSK